MPRDFMEMMKEDGVQANENLNAAQGTTPAAGRAGFINEPTSGVPASLGMSDPAVGDVQRKAIEAQRHIDTHPAIASFAGRSPAHVAATQDDWPVFGKIASALSNLNTNTSFWYKEFGQKVTEIQTLQKSANPQDRARATQLADSFGFFDWLSHVPDVVTRPIAQEWAKGGSILKDSYNSNDPAQYAAKVRELSGALGSLFPIGASARWGQRTGPPIDLGMARRVDGPLRLLPGPGEKVIDAEFTLIAGHTRIAQAHHDAVKAVEKQIASTPTAKETPALIKEFLSDTAIGQRKVWVNPQALVDLYAEGHVVLPEYAQAASEAMATGRDLEVPMADYLADSAGKPYADTLREHTRFTEEGVSVGEGKAAGEIAARLPVLQGEPLPSRGLAPANQMQDGTIYVGPPNTLHFQIAEKFPGTEGNSITDTGFVTPQGQYLNRTEAAQWVRDNEQATFTPSDNTEEGLDALDYKEQVPVGERKTQKSQREVPEDLTSQAAPLRTMAAQAESAVEEVFAELTLTKLFETNKAVGLTKAQFERYSVKIDEARFAAEDRILQRTYAQLRHERTPEWKVQVEQERASVEAEAAQDRQWNAVKELQYSEGPNGEPLQRNFAPESIFQGWDGGYKLERGVVKDLYGASAVEALPARMFAAKGQHPDDIAKELGYDTGEELVTDLLVFEQARLAGGHDSSRAMMKAQVTEEAAARARKRLGYDVSREGLVAAAREAAVLPQVSDFLEDSLRDLAELVGLPFNKEQVQAAAKEQFDALTVKQATNIKLFERGMWSMGNKTQVALEKDDWPAAFISRQKQLLNFYQLRASHFLAKKVAKGNKDFTRWGKKASIKGLAQPFLDQMHTYLPQWGYSVKREPQELAEALRGVTLEEFVDNIQAVNAEFPPIPAVVAAEVDDLTVNDYYQVRGFIYALSRFGRELQSARNAEGRTSFSYAVRTAVATVPPGKPPKELQGDSVKGPITGTASWLRRYDAFHRKTADMLEWMDGGNPLGIWFENIVAGPYAGSDMEHALHKEHYTPLEKGWAGVNDSTMRSYPARIVTNFHVGGQTLKDGTVMPFWPVAFHRRNIPVMALYTGSAESLTKAAAGYNVSEEEYLATVNKYITPEEAAWVQEIWNQFEALAPKVSEALRVMTGEGLKRIEATPVELAGMQLTGGYWPIKYNSQLNPDVAAWELEQQAKLSQDGVEHLWGELFPNMGFTKARTKYMGAVDFGLDQIATAFNAHIKYASYARAVSDARKFVADPRIGGALEAKFGPEYGTVISEWLNGIVMPHNPNPSKMIRWADDIFEGLARNMSVGALTFSYGTLISQTLGVFNAIGELSDGGNPAQGLVRLLDGYGQALKLLGNTQFEDGKINFKGFSEMFSRSEMMRGRYGTVEQNMMELLEGGKGFDALDGWKVGKGMRDVSHFGFKLIGYTEFVFVSGPQWLGREKAALLAGETPERAARLADRSVVKAQGSGRKVDQAAIQRARGMWKLMYAFQSYFNQQYQNTVDVYRNAVGGGAAPPMLPPPPEVLDAEEGPDGVWVVGKKTRYSINRAVLVLLFFMVIPGLMGDLIQGKKLKPFSILANMFRPLWGLNTVSSFFNQHVGYEDGEWNLKPVYNTQLGDDLMIRIGEILGRNIQLATKVGKLTEEGDPVSLGRPVQTVAGLAQIAGVPGAGALGRAGEYTYQVKTGKQDPKNWIDKYFGLTNGPREDQKVEQ